MRKSRHSELWKYLEASGVLEKGSDEEIKAVKREYRKKSMHAFKQKQRKTKPEYIVNFDVHNGEHGRVELASKRHNLSMSAFIRLAVLAYIDRTYIVPNPQQIAQFESALSSCLHEISTIVKAKEKWYWQREEKMESIEKRIAHLESVTDEIFRHPKMTAP